MRLLRRAVVQELPALGDHSTIQDVRIEATELLREAFAQCAAGEDEVVLRLAGLGEDATPGDGRSSRIVAARRARGAPT